MSNIDEVKGFVARISLVLIPPACNGTLKIAFCFVSFRKFVAARVLFHRWTLFLPIFSLIDFFSPY